MPLEFDAAVMDIAKALLPYVLALLVLDVILIFILRRIWTPRQKPTRPADETQTITHLSFGNRQHDDTSQPIETDTYRHPDSSSAANTATA